MHLKLERKMNKYVLFHAAKTYNFKKYANFFLQFVFLKPLKTTMHFVEGFALVMLCNCRSYPRKLAVMILKEVKNLSRALGLPETEPYLIDVIDKCCPQVCRIEYGHICLNKYG